jgi:hypothetical protein
MAFIRILYGMVWNGIVTYMVNKYGMVIITTGKYAQLFLEMGLLRWYCKLIG